nr:hypothetical protein [Candidatus Sigynarchaeota archaeon]
MTVSTKSKDAPLPTRVLLTSFAIFIAIFILFLHSHEINNYFDVRPYFSFEILVPTLIAMLATIIIQRFVDHRFLVATFSCAAVVVLLLFGLKSTIFEMFNGDDVMFIAGYMIVYEQVLFIALVATIACLMYMSVVRFLNELRNNQVKASLLMRNGLSDAILFSLETIIFLVIAAKVSFGVSVIVMAGAIVAS